MIVSFDDHLLVHLVHLAAGIEQGIQVENIETVLSSGDHDWLQKHTCTCWLPSQHTCFVPAGWCMIVTRIKVEEVQQKATSTATAEPAPEDFGMLLSIPVWDRKAWTCEQPVAAKLKEWNQLHFNEKKSIDFWVARAAAFEAAYTEIYS